MVYFSCNISTTTPYQLYHSSSEDLARPIMRPNRLLTPSLEGVVGTLKLLGTELCSEVVAFHFIFRAVK